jgi:glycyl-tRNA synthetase beta chain
MNGHGQAGPTAMNSPALVAEGIPRRPFLLEIGSEEIPARFVPTASAALGTTAAALLGEMELAPEGLRTFATPRRLVLFCDALAVRQPDRMIEVKGPPTAVAFGADGVPTAAAIGFARKNGVDLGDCIKLADDRGEYLGIRKLEKGRTAPEVLMDLLPGLVSRLPFPKVMRWGEGSLEYARPLRWLVALLGKEVVPLHWGDVIADRLTHGHRTLARDCLVSLASAEGYLETMRQQGVMADPQERRRRIEAGLIAALTARVPEGEYLADEELMLEVVYLCENPMPFVGDFNAGYFELPDKVIVTALKAHQRYFAVRHKGTARLLPHFVAVRDGGEHALEVVRQGNERVLEARLADALFYWKFDQRRSPDEHVEQLRAVTWLEGFGSLYDKIERLQVLVTWLWETGWGGGRPVPAELPRAAYLCKSDLVSEMIKDGKEFTKLEGMIGARYAREAGESEAVCRAIERHYLPRGSAEELPGDALSEVLAAADRLDNLAGCWLAGFAPTGAKDPYGLRRQALALLRITLAGEFRYRLHHLMTQALSPFMKYKPKADIPQAATDLRDFVVTRLAGYLSEAKDCPAEVIRAVIPVHGDDPTDAWRWSQALAHFKDQKDFLLLAKGFKRCKNILEGRFLAGEELTGSAQRWLAGGRGAAGESFEELDEPAEVALRKKVAEQVQVLMDNENNGDYRAVFGILSQLGPHIDLFFDEVMVNVSDSHIRELRHVFLREIHALFIRYADFSEIAPTDV